MIERKKSQKKFKFGRKRRFYSSRKKFSDAYFAIKVSVFEHLVLTVKLAWNSWNLWKSSNWRKSSKTWNLKFFEEITLRRNILQTIYGDCVWLIFLFTVMILKSDRKHFLLLSGLIFIKRKKTYGLPNRRKKTDLRT